MAQVLGNLVGNALRYTPEGGRITLSAERRIGAVHLVVSDTGSGIDPADLPHIFDRFYRGDDARAISEGESGLGLAIAKSLVEAHGGSISASSRLGEGSVFTIVLPVTV
jgi:signal transduction histidine kinase